MGILPGQCGARDGKGGGVNMVVVVVVWVWGRGDRGGGRQGRVAGGGGQDIPCISSFASKAFDDIMTTSRDRLRWNNTATRASPSPSHLLLAVAGAASAHPG
mgnify:CR=1 FL=1